ncbi:unnamed protein product [Rotaria socialis]|uniref:Uncharacterized protein n=2 Tax=Rotaria socialis TaxID=392032 RepID=A0A820UM72_9BILA|nr:unnamed protein product [Rotaria socialis]
MTVLLTHSFVGLAPPLIDGVPITLHYQTDSFKKLCEWFSTEDRSHLINIHMILPITNMQIALNQLLLSALGTNNKSEAIDIIRRWIWIFKQSSLKNFRIVGFSTDGDPRHMRAMRLVTVFFATLPNIKSNSYTNAFHLKIPKEWNWYFLSDSHLVLWFQDAANEKSIHQQLIEAHQEIANLIQQQQAQAQQYQAQAQQHQAQTQQLQQQIQDLEHQVAQLQQELQQAAPPQPNAVPQQPSPPLQQPQVPQQPSSASEEEQQHQNFVTTSEAEVPQHQNLRERGARMRRRLRRLVRPRPRDVRVDNLCARRLVQVEQIESQKELRGGIDRNLFPFPFQLVDTSIYEKLLTTYLMQTKYEKSNELLNKWSSNIYNLNSIEQLVRSQANDEKYFLLECSVAIVEEQGNVMKRSNIYLEMNDPQIFQLINRKQLYRDILPNIEKLRLI